MPTVIIKKEFPDTKEVDFSRKRDNFLENAPQYVEAGILPREETESLTQALSDDKLRMDKKNEDKKIAHDSNVVFHEEHPSVVTQLRGYKKAADNNPLITPEIRQELELYNEEKSETTNGKKPDLKGREAGGQAQVTYTKKPMHGILLYARINGGEYDFETVVKDSKFTDTRPRKNPKEVEIREYYAYYIYDGKKVGKQSEIVRIVLPPIE
jgi:hypothetical protein